MLGLLVFFFGKKNSKLLSFIAMSMSTQPATICWMYHVSDFVLSNNDKLQ